jgi:hypothetical protein
MHRVGEHRITFGEGVVGLAFRISDQGGGFIAGSFDGTAFLDSARGSSGPDSSPTFNPQRRKALGLALAERNQGGGAMLQDREER